jgi:hypothetical protein
MNPVKIQHRMVKKIKNGFFLLWASETAPIIGSKAAAKTIEIDKAKPYSISSPFLSMVTQRAKYREMTFIENMVLAKSYNAQLKVTIPFFTFLLTSDKIGEYLIIL